MKSFVNFLNIESFDSPFFLVTTTIYTNLLPNIYHTQQKNITLFTYWIDLIALLNLSIRQVNNPQISDEEHFTMS
ncbi:MAG: hypothetical protein RI947_204 [Candidatus Parcubacteria bacterium]|jgi:hypothetical protein